MEHHHFDQCLMLLSSHGNQLLANVSKVTSSHDGSMKYSHNNMCLQEEFKSVILLIEEAILATDLAIYFKNRGDAFALLSSGSVNWSR